MLSYTICFAQSDFNTDNIDNENNSDASNSDQDSIQGPEIPHFRHTWKWMNGGVYLQNIPLDTLMNGIQNFNPIFKKSISNTYLGNFPSPYESNIFMDRNNVQDFYPLTYIRAYLFLPEDALNYNTTTPLTQLKYFTGGGKGQAENLLSVLHVQNINPFWNVGIRYHLLSGDGRYAHQKSTAYNFSFFSNYERERTVLSFFINQNNGDFLENGGIKERAEITDSTEIDSENMPVWLNEYHEAQNVYRNTNFNFQAQYNLGNPKEIIVGTDSLSMDTSYTYAAKAVFNFKAEGNEHKYKEKTINHDFYPNTYIDSLPYTYDKVANQIYDLSAKFVLNEHPTYKYLPGVYLGLNYKQEIYNQRTAYDTTTHIQSFGKTNYTGMHLTAGLFNIDTSALLNYDLSAKLCVLGHYVGNFNIDGYIIQALRKDKSSLLRADATIKLQSPNPFLDHYVGNHNIWDNDFKSIKTIQVEGRYINTRLRTELGVGISNTFSYIYFDTIAAPQQTSKTLMVFTAWAKQHFRAGNFHFDQKVYFQKSTQEDIVSLPAFSVYSHNYYQNHLFKKALELQIGVDLFYNTEFYADNYMPSIMQFYNQREFKIGNYPKVDVFLNLKIQTAIIFAKYEHLNYLLKRNGNYFSASDYPINPAIFKFGIQWNFFD